MIPRVGAYTGELIFVVWPTINQPALPGSHLLLLPYSLFLEGVRNGLADLCDTQAKMKRDEATHGTAPVQLMPRVAFSKTTVDAESTEQVVGLGPIAIPRWEQSPLILLSVLLLHFFSSSSRISVLFPLLLLRPSLLCPSCIFASSPQHPGSFSSLFSQIPPRRPFHSLSSNSPCSLCSVPSFPPFPLRTPVCRSVLALDAVHRVLFPPFPSMGPSLSVVPFPCHPLQFGGGGRAFMYLWNPTYAGRGAHQIVEADLSTARRPTAHSAVDVVLEFVLSGCLSVNALSDYAAICQVSIRRRRFAIFRDLCRPDARRAWRPATMPKASPSWRKRLDLDGGRRNSRSGWR